MKISKRLPALLIAVIAASTMLSACTRSILPGREELPENTHTVDRHILVGAGEDVVDTDTASAAIIAFIDKYNEKVDEDMKITDYQILLYEDVYTIIGANGVKYACRLDANGDIMTFTPSAGTAEQKITASTAIMDMLWDRKYIPADKEAYIQEINNSISDLLYTIASERAQMAENNLDTNMPDVTDLTDRANAIKADFDKYKSEILGVEADNTSSAQQE